MVDIRKMRIQKRAFDVFGTLNYYGGSTKCIIKDKEDTEAYNFMAVNGHLPEFGDFWTAQKEELEN